LTVGVSGGSGGSDRVDVRQNRQANIERARELIG